MKKEPAGKQRRMWLRMWLLAGWIQGLTASTVLTFEVAPSVHNVGDVLLTIVFGMAALGLFQKKVVLLIVDNRAMGDTTRFPWWFVYAVGTGAGVAGRILAITVASGKLGGSLFEGVTMAIVASTLKP